MSGRGATPALLAFRETRWVTIQLHVFNLLRVCFHAAAQKFRFHSVLGAGPKPAPNSARTSGVNTRLISSAIVVGGDGFLAGRGGCSLRSCRLIRFFIQFWERDLNPLPI